MTSHDRSRGALLAVVLIAVSLSSVAPVVGQSPGTEDVGGQWVLESVGTNHPDGIIDVEEERFTAHWTLEESGMTGDETWDYNGSSGSAHHELSIQGVPQTVAPGETFSVTLTATASGSDAGRQRYELRTDIMHIEDSRDANGYTYTSIWTDEQTRTNTQDVALTIPQDANENLAYRFWLYTHITTGVVAEVGYTYEWSATGDDTTESEPEPDEEELEPTLFFQGRATVLDGDNQLLPLERATVRIAIHDDQDNVADVFETFTDEEGRYQTQSRTFVPGGSYAVQLLLRDFDGILDVRSQEREALGGTVNLVRSGIPLPEAAEVIDLEQDLRIQPPFEGLEPGRMNALGRAYDISVPFEFEHHREAAVVYHHTYEALAYARDELGLSYNHSLPVDVVVHDDGDGAHYDVDESTISIGGEAGVSAVDLPDAPLNREYHEFGHHVHADAVMGGENSYPLLARGDTNHGGVRNSDSSDSLVEGFAIFFALLVNEDPEYTVGNGSLDLEKNRWLIGKAVPGEELNFAGLLWDLVDDDEESSDRIALGVEGTWELLNQRERWRISGFYEDVSEAHGDERSAPGDPLSDVDRLFIVHGFYSDTNQNGRWDEGEQIGLPDLWEGSGRLGLPVPAGTSLVLDARDAQGEPAELDAVEVTILHTDPSPDSTWRARLGPDRTVDLVLPADAVRAEIAPLDPGMGGETVVVNATSYRQAVADAITAGDQIFATRQLEVTPASIGPPDDLVAQDAGDGTVSLSWTLPPEAVSVVLVRGFGHAPEDPMDGEILLEAPATGFEDAVFGPVEHLYSLFALGPDGSLSTPATASLTPSSNPETPATDPEQTIVGEEQGATGEVAPASGGTGTATKILGSLAIVLAATVLGTWLLLRLERR